MRSDVNKWERHNSAEPREKWLPLGGMTALGYAAREGCAACVPVLVDAGAEINGADQDGITPLLSALINGHYDTAGVLIQKGADPNTADRIVDAELVHTTRQFIARRFPGLRTAPLVDSRVCQYENTSTGDIIIDRHPAWPNMLIAGGGSGHGFKHRPAVARHVVDLIKGRVRPNPRFSVASKTTEPQRAVF